MEFFTKFFGTDKGSGKKEERKYTWEKKREELQTEYYFQLLVVGTPGVGKTSIIHRFVYDDFSKSYHPTFGIDLYVAPGSKFRNGRNILKKFPLQVRVKILDVPHSELRGNHINYLLRETHGVILVFDVTNPKSVAGIDQWRRRIPKGYLCLLVANKADKSLHHVVQQNDMSDFVLRADFIGWYLTSARNKIDTDVFDAFDYMIMCICKRMLNRFNGFPRPKLAHLFSVDKLQFYKDKEREKSSAYRRKRAKRKGLFRTLQVEELVEKFPFRGEEIESGYVSSNQKNEDTKNKKGGGKGQPNESNQKNGRGNVGKVVVKKIDQKKDRVRAFNAFTEECGEFYSDLKSRIREYENLYPHEEQAMKLLSLIRQEIEHEKTTFMEKISSIVEIYKQTDLLDAVMKRQFMEFKREFYTEMVSKWTKLVSALKNHFFVGEKLSISRELMEEIVFLLKSHTIIKMKKRDSGQILEEEDEGEEGEEEEKKKKVDDKKSERKKKSKRFKFREISSKIEKSMNIYPTILSLHRRSKENGEQTSKKKKEQKMRMGFQF